MKILRTLSPEPQEPNCSICNFRGSKIKGGFEMRPLQLIRIFCLALAISTSVTMPASAQSTAANSNLSLRVAVGGISMLFLNYFWALDNGYFKDEGINVTSIQAKNGPMSTQAVITGEADVATDNLS